MCVRTSLCVRVCTHDPFQDRATHKQKTARVYMNQLFDSLSSDSKASSDNIVFCVLEGGHQSSVKVENICRDIETKHL